MTAALAYIETHWREQPSLASIAAAVSLSPAHFQRLFTRWVGLSPSVLTRYYAYRAARAALVADASVLAAALEAGFSGPSRLHDACLLFEALRPGEVRRRGAGLMLRWGLAPSPFGMALLFASERGLTGLAFADKGDLGPALADMQARWPEARFARDDAGLAATAGAIFQAGHVPSLHVLGTPFQVKVWEALLAIPPGRTSTYEALAGCLGRTGAARAVGTAVGANPISWLIPCHRVLRRSGALGGYHWGLERKVAMLTHEALQAAAKR